MVLLVKVGIQTRVVTTFISFVNWTKKNRKKIMKNLYKIVAIDITILSKTVSVCMNVLKCVISINYAQNLNFSMFDLCTGCESNVQISDSLNFRAIFKKV